MSTIKVLLAGTGGIPGRYILAAFENYTEHAAKTYNISFDITILKRNTSSSTPTLAEAPHNHVHISDFSHTTDLSTLITELNPAIIISALNAEPAPTLDNLLLDSVVQFLSTSNTNISRTRSRPLLYISGYTLDLLHRDVKRILSPTQFATLSPKILFSERLTRTARDRKDQFAYATVVCAGFLDYCLIKGYLGIDIPNRRATLHDEGNKTITGCSVKFIGDAVVAIALKHLSNDPAKQASVRNQRVRVAETFFSGRDLLDTVEQCTNQSFEVSYDSSSDMLKAAKVNSYLNWSKFSRASTFTEDGLEFDEDEYLSGRRRTLRAICKEAIAGGGEGFEGVGR